MESNTMKRWNWVIALFVLGVLLAMPAYADQRLSVTGQLDNHIRVFKNNSATDDDLTNNDDEPFGARTRGRITFSVAATEFSKAHVGLEFDQFWGDSRSNISGSGASPTRCVVSGVVAAPGQTPSCTTVNGGFDIGTDNFVLELRHLYVEFKLPGTPVQFRIGGLPVEVSRLKGNLLLTMDVAAIEALYDISPQLKLQAYYSQSEEDFDGSFAAKLGEDYFLGLTLQTIPWKGLDVDLIFAYQHLQGPNYSTATQRFATAGLRQEDRWWLGVDARWRFGGLTVSPTFIYQGGTREFTTAGDGNISAILLDIRGAYVIGPLTVTGKFAYTSGNKAGDDLGPNGDVDFFQPIAIDTVHRSVDWFEILGFNIDTTHPPLFGFNDTRSMRSNMSFDQFGLIHGAVRADFQALQNLVLTGALGFFSAAEKVGRPARLGPSTPGNNFNYTGQDKYLGTELDVWLRYTMFRGTDLDVWFAYAFMGDALNLDNPVRQAEDAVGAGARILYRF
jgi:hypothetical protein